MNVRSYRGIGDLPPLLAFASAATASRSPLLASWHPGDIAWELRTGADRPRPARFWMGRDGVEALVWRVGEGEYWMEALPRSEALIPELVLWAQEDARASAEGGGVKLKIRAFDYDHRRLAAFEALGIHKADPEGVDFRLDLTGDLPEATLPAGVSIRDSVGVDPEARAAAHRAAWDHLEHLGIDARSSFTAAAYDTIRALPVYDPRLDMLAVAPGGALVASCIAWADGASGVGVFEPVGVAPAWRGRRIARAIMLEAARRMKEPGVWEARVGTRHFNAAAIGAYLAAGFAPAGGFHWWTRDLS